MTTHSIVHVWYSLMAKYVICKIDHFGVNSRLFTDFCEGLWTDHAVLNIIFDKYGISQNPNSLGSNNCLPFFGFLLCLRFACLIQTPLLASMQRKGFEPNYWLTDNLKALTLDYFQFQILIDCFSQLRDVNIVTWTLRDLHLPCLP